MINWDELVLAPCEDIFGEPVIFSPINGTPVTVTGILDKSFHELDEAEAAPRNVMLVSVGLRLAQLPRPPVEGDLVTHVSTGTVYKVRQPRPDGHGNVRCMLNFYRQDS